MIPKRSCFLHNQVTRGSGYLTLSRRLNAGVSVSIFPHSLVLMVLMTVVWSVLLSITQSRAAEVRGSGRGCLEPDSYYSSVLPRNSWILTVYRVCLQAA